MLARRNACVGSSERQGVARLGLQSCGRRRCLVASAVQSGLALKVTSGQSTAQGTTRRVNEDRLVLQVFDKPNAGAPAVWAAVFDGHGGSTVAQWLQDKLLGVVQTCWQQGKKPEAAMTEAYLQADKKLLASSGFLGLGERGVGGSKCGATSSSVLIYQDPTSGETMLLAANVGDARTLLIRDGQAVQLSVDHVPDSEFERQRIEQSNPNPKLPLVRYIGGTWRVGGLLALSRAFGDAYLKGSLQFEGMAFGGDNRYSSGFGLIAVPHTTLTTLTEKDTWLVISSDGLFSEEERGGGGGLDNAGVAKMCGAAGAKADLNALAQQMVKGAVAAGSTDDVTVLVLRLGRA